MTDLLPEQIEAIIKDRADWLLDAVAGATQNRMFLRGDPEYDDVAGGAILLNGEKAIRVVIEAYEATRTPPDDAWLSQDDAECELKDAIDTAFGPLGDDKPILARLREKGIWLAWYDVAALKDIGR